MTPLFMDISDISIKKTILVPMSGHDDGVEELVPLRPSQPSCAHLKRFSGPMHNCGVSQVVQVVAIRADIGPKGFIVFTVVTISLVADEADEGRKKE